MIIKSISRRLATVVILPIVYCYVSLQAQESIFLVDDHRLSVLYVPSGKTRRRVNKLQPLLEDVTTLSHSENGKAMLFNFLFEK